jgi:hypothetical protein
MLEWCIGKSIVIAMGKGVILKYILCYINVSLCYVDISSAPWIIFLNDLIQLSWKTIIYII